MFRLRITDLRTRCHLEITVNKNGKEVIIKGH
jgi:hypothetical protein